MQVRAQKVVSFTLVKKSSHAVCSDQIHIGGRFIKCRSVGHRNEKMML